MADKQYKTLFGIVAFDPKDDQTKNGREVKRVRLNVIGQGDPEVHLTIWMSTHPGASGLKQFDWVAARGEYQSNVSDGRTYHNVSAHSLAINGQRIERVEAGRTSGGQAELPVADDEEIPF